MSSTCPVAPRPPPSYPTLGHWVTVQRLAHPCRPLPCLTPQAVTKGTNMAPGACEGRGTKRVTQETEGINLCGIDRCTWPPCVPAAAVCTARLTCPAPLAPRGSRDTHQHHGLVCFFFFRPISAHWKSEVSATQYGSCVVPACCCCVSAAGGGRGQHHSTEARRANLDWRGATTAARR